MKNNKPKYIVIDFDEYNEISTLRQIRDEKIMSMADDLIESNLEAFKELAK